MKPLIHQIIFYGSYLAWVFLVFLIFFALKKRKVLLKKTKTCIAFVFLLSLTLVFIYARFIEPQIILTQITKIQTGFSARVVVISDIHLGVYKNNNFLKRIVKKINALQDIDFVLIPGDFTYYPPADLQSLFSPLKEIKYPTYAVLGNHDSEKPGPPIQKALQSALESHGVFFLHNTSLKVKNKDITILGLGDRWAKEDDASQINRFTTKDHLIVLTHNPDTIDEYDDSNIADLTIAGHTHGGQIRIPFLYKKMIKSQFGFDEGLYDTKVGKVFVSAGVGTIGLPMRFLIPPRIDVLELY